jgi:hypothetical protein
MFTLYEKYAELHDSKEIGGKKDKLRRLKLWTINVILGELKQKISKAFKCAFKALCLIQN